MRSLRSFSLHGSKMLHQRYDFDPSKRYIFLRLPLDTTLHCTIETHDGLRIIAKSPEFPCRCVRNREDKFSITIAGVDNSNALQSDNLGKNSYRFIYRLEPSVESSEGQETVFLPLNNQVKFSFAFGSDENFSIGKGGNDVRLLYEFDDSKKVLTTTWISSPWRLSWTIPSLRGKLENLKTYLQLQ